GSVNLPDTLGVVPESRLAPTTALRGEFRESDSPDLESCSRPGRDLGISSSEDDNFEDEFDPILASVRGSSNPIANLAPTVVSSSPDRYETGWLEKKDFPLGNDGIEMSTAGDKLKNRILSIFPSDGKVRPGELIAKSVAHIEKSVGEYRSAFESKTLLVGNKRRRDEGSRSMEDKCAVEASGTGRESYQEGIPLVSASDLLSDEERQQLEAMAGKMGNGGGRWRRMGKYAAVVAG
ncbi:unnamed protein product, partial [Choristocarpus tenellus]